MLGSATDDAPEGMVTTISTTSTGDASTDTLNPEPTPHGVQTVTTMSTTSTGDASADTVNAEPTPRGVQTAPLPAATPVAATTDASSVETRLKRTLQEAASLKPTLHAEETKLPFQVAPLWKPVVAPAKATCPKPTLHAEETKLPFQVAPLWKPVVPPAKTSTTGTSEDESSDESSEAGGTEWVDTAERCEVVCAQLLQLDTVAIDLEGVNLGRDGEVCIVQAANASGQVFLFDVATAGAALFPAGLARFLEAESVAKLLYDCRSDGDALLHLHGVRLRHVLDMQVLCARATAPKCKHLPGMARALERALPYAEAQRLKGLKMVGQRMFAPEHGGSCEVWKQRPLPQVLQSYCTADVVQLFAMWRKWKGCLERPTLRAISEERMRARAERTVGDAAPPHPALVDFPLEEGPDAKRQKLEELEPKRQRLCEQGTDAG